MTKRKFYTIKTLVAIGLSVFIYFCIDLYFKNLITKKQGYLHFYEKEARENRKIGHINFYGDVHLGGYDE